MSEDPDTLWPPQEGQLLPRAAEAVGMRIKLAAYSLDLAHEKGGPKAQGFKLILGITIEDIDYLEDAIETAILDGWVVRAHAKLPTSAHEKSPGLAAPVA